MKNVLLLIGALFLVPFAMEAQTVEFSDDFESGLDNWVLEGTWGLTTAQSQSPDNSLTDSPGGNYAANLSISATLANPIDLTTALDATLNFSAIYDIEGGNFDYCYVEASPDGGATWVNIATFLGEGNLFPWQSYSYSLGGLVGNAEVLVRFRLFTDGGYEVDGIYIDDVEITSSDVDNGPPLVLHNAPEFYEGGPGDIVMVAQIVDVSGVATNTLSYSVDGMPASSTIDGVNVIDDFYTYTIPAQASGAQVDYSLSVSDASAQANTTNTATFSYIAGQHVFYDNAEVNFVNTFGPDAASGLLGCAVRFSTFGADITYALIRNYTDANRPNSDIEVHVWADDNGVPGDDLIDPITVTPEATLEINSPMTRVDLRPFADQLSGITGDVFVGYTVAAGETWLTQTTPAVAGRTYVWDGAAWTQIDDDYHFRIVTEAVLAGNDCAEATDISGALGGGPNNPVFTPLFDNTDATVGAMDVVPGCWDDETLENTQWFSFVGDGLLYQIRTQDCGSVNYNDDTQIAIYTGDDCGNLTEVACNEDEDVASEIYNVSTTLETEAGVTYYVMIDGWLGTVGEYCFEFTEISLITCADIALGASEAVSQFVCLGATTEVTLDDGTVIPVGNGTNGFRWIVSGGDVSGSDNPAADPTYFGAFGESPTPYTPALLNDGTQLPAGDYYFTPVVYGGAVAPADGNFANYDYTDGCLLTGNSILITLLPALAAVTATTTVADEMTPPGSNGEASVSASGGSGAYAYEWSNGETTATISGLTAGDYTVTVTDLSGCVDPYTETVTVDMIVSVADVDFAQSIRLFPNPAKDMVNIDYSFEDSRNLMITVTNAVGQVVHQQEAPQGQMARVELDLSSYSNGVYFVQFNDGADQLTRRLIVNK